MTPAAAALARFVGRVIIIDSVQEAGDCVVVAVRTVVGAHGPTRYLVIRGKVEELKPGHPLLRSLERGRMGTLPHPRFGVRGGPDDGPEGGAA